MISQIHSKASNDGLILTLQPSLASPCADWPPQFKQLSRKPEKLPDCLTCSRCILLAGSCSHVAVVLCCFCIGTSLHVSNQTIRFTKTLRKSLNNIEDVYKSLQIYVPCGFKPWLFDLLHLQLTSSSPRIAASHRICKFCVSSTHGQHILIHLS